MMLIPRLPVQNSKVNPVAVAQAYGPQLQLTYSIVPPNQSTSIERRKATAALQSERIAALPIDALLVYDLQDESARNGTPRPFRYQPKVDALNYAYEDLNLGTLPRVVYRAIADQDETQLRRWLGRLHSLGGHAVLVGAPSRSSATQLSLPQVMNLCRKQMPLLAFGGVLIAERHQTTGTEDVRIWNKVQDGCRFFISQTVWSAEATKGLLRDLRLRAQRVGGAVPPISITLSPCGSEKTLLLQEWLGVYLPPAIRNELLAAGDMLTRSIELATNLFVEIQTFAAEQGLRVGCNVESVSSRADEVAASLELLKRVADVQRRERPSETGALRYGAMLNDVESKATS